MIKNFSIITATIMAILLCETASKSVPVYSINYVRSFREDLFEKNFGCQKNIAYGIYKYPMGTSDALQMLENPFMYQGSKINCSKNNTFYKIFGHGQDYEELIKIPANTINSMVKQGARKTKTKKIIIDWKYPIHQNPSQNSRKWLYDFIQKFKNECTVYIKAPASYFCFQINTKKYLLDLENAQNFIIQTYGEQLGKYTTYESLFSPNQEKLAVGEYSDPQCPQYPSYATLKQNYPSKNFYIEKTLQTQQAGFIGEQEFENFINKASSTYTSQFHFYDSFSQQQILL